VINLDNSPYYCKQDLHMAPVIITLLTDFGLKDNYTASMKGVILGINPHARLVDVSHLVPPQDIRSGAFLLRRVYQDFPPGTIHLAVVDPGVGTSRRGLAMKAGGYFFVGPDNGLFSWILRKEHMWSAHSLEVSAYWRRVVSRTFHGRDIFAPVAAHLASGVDVSAFGPACSPLLAPWSSPEGREDELAGEVVYVDHFGNAITNLTRKDLDLFAPSDQWAVTVGEQSISKVAETYGDEAPGSIMALIGSDDHLEIAVSQGDAAGSLGIRAGSPVSVRRRRLSSVSS
jgi:S-adenosyl-L-methionine hydrolase (adenosine-forming)